MPPKHLMFRICSVTEKESSGSKIGIQSHNFSRFEDSLCGIRTLGLAARGIKVERKNFECGFSFELGRAAQVKHDRPAVFELTTTLREVKVPIITIECRACGRSDALQRKILVRKHGAGMTFARLRRMAAMGCDRLNGERGDRCQTRFPCLEAVTD